MLKIGDFSRLSRVSVKALRHYDELELLKPDHVDRFTGYRYYAAHQLPRLNRILALKELGLSLEQIGRLLNEELPPAQIVGMLRLKRAEIRQGMGEAQARLAQIEARLKQLEQEGKMSAYDAVIKKVDALRVAAIRDVIPTYGDQGPLWGELMAWLPTGEASPTGPGLTIYHDTEYREQDVDVEVCQPVAAPVADHGRVKVHELPAVETMACLVHRGSYDGFSDAYGALMGWIEGNGYRIVGPNREMYLVAMGMVRNPAEYVTEIQFPVVKA
ncbi:MAG: MerR family transcriptional regulator [Chloroflexi bacterium HGW-Chloroflexi-1]|nr:MAG: MerR family transcriptional regulator [Chloroflexi bacterium HGW-Chloroflexi-1]